MGIASIARTEQVEVATTCRKFATSDLRIVNCDEIRMCLLSGRTTKITGSRQVIVHSITPGFATPVHFLLSGKFDFSSA